MNFPGFTSLLFLLPLLLASVSMVGAGWFWELGNGLGLAALAGILYLCVDRRNGASLKSHEAASWLVLVLVAVHALWFLLGEPLSWQYFIPGHSIHLWSGLLALLLVLLLVFSARTNSRREHFSNYGNFRRWHRWLAVVLVASALHHVISSGLYFPRMWQQLALVAAAVTVLLLPGQNRLRYASLPPLIILSAVVIVLFIVLGQWPL